MESAPANGYEHVSGSGHNNVGQDLCPEHFLIEFQARVDIQGEQVGMMNMMDHAV
jgi:hypothetical protein